jgi:hypothetical protein
LQALGGLDWHSTAVLGNALGALAASSGGTGGVHSTPPDVLAFLRQQIDLPAYHPWRDAVAQAVGFVHSLGVEQEEFELGCRLEQAVCPVGCSSRPASLFLVARLTRQQVLCYTVTSNLPAWERGSQGHE